MLAVLDLRFRVVRSGKEVANLPIKELGDDAPEYDRPWVETPARQRLETAHVPEPEDYAEALATLLGSANGCSRRWVWEQYDTIIGGDTLQRPGGDAGVVRVGPRKALAFTSDVSPHYVVADPVEGGRQAVAEAFRNLTAVGAEPIAATDNLNFASPEDPVVMGQLVGAIRGIGEACEALGMPIVSGNVSLYNGAKGEHAKAILPTPTIGGVGLIEDAARVVTIGGAGEGDAVLLVGGDGTWLGQSRYARELQGTVEGAPPPVDLPAEDRAGALVRAAISSGIATACHDVSAGGLAVALGEMALASGRGLDATLPGPVRHAAWFGEDQARYVVCCRPEDVAPLVADAGDVPLREIGRVTGGSLVLDGIEMALAELREFHENWLPAYARGNG